MHEVYTGYRSERKKNNLRKDRQQPSYAKKFVRQLTVSIICFSAVYSLKMADTDFAADINSCIKSALNYKVDTSKITGIIDGLIEKADIEAASPVVPRDPEYPEIQRSGEDTNVQNSQNTPSQNL